MANVLLELVCCSLEDCLVAAEAGAHRIELCSAIELSGLTPSAGLIEAVMARQQLPVVSMVRPRTGGFAFTDEEYENMLRDVVWARQFRVQGIVTGMLNPDGTVDKERSARMREAIGDTTAVFHRAFDVTPDPFEALETLIELGYDRVLTSGQKNSCVESAPTIKKLIEQAAGRIEVLPGGGIRPDNVAEVVRLTGTDKVHMALYREKSDTSCQCNPTLVFNKPTGAPEDKYSVTDLEGVKQVLAAL